MKLVLTSLFSLLIVATTCFGQQTQTTTKAADVIKFTEVKHDFGKIKQSVTVNYAFTFKNISKQPVVIESATASCGCTTPTFSKTPVMKNKADKITTGFTAPNVGPFNKTIYVKVAGIDQPLELIITGEVLNAADYAKYEAEKDSKKSS